MDKKSISISYIDDGQTFDWGKTSEDYAKYRDIYPDHKITAPIFGRILKTGGKFLILYMGWLPFEDKIAGKSEEIILKYNPKWTGCGDTVHPVWVPNEYSEFFNLVSQEEFRVDVPFTREAWHGSAFE